MTKPMILAIDDDTTRRETLAPDLERRFGADYRVVALDSASQGLATFT